MTTETAVPAAPASAPAPAGAAPATAPAPAPAASQQPATPALKEILDAAKPAEPTILGKEPEAAKPAAEDKKPEEAPKPAEVELKLPEGVKVDAAVLDQFKAAVAEGPKGAQKLLDLHLATLAKQAEVFQQQRSQQVAEWRKTVEADPALGGAHLPETVASAQRAMAKFATPAFKAALEESGLGNHPEMVRFVAAVGASLKEDSIAGKSGAGAAPASQDEVLRLRYPSMFPNT